MRWAGHVARVEKCLRGFSGETSREEVTLKPRRRWACGACGGGEKCLRGFGGETSREEVSLRPRRRWEVDIKVSVT
jgi:hypothetical protein